MSYFDLTLRVPEVWTEDSAIVASLYELVAQVPLMRTVHRRFLNRVRAQEVTRGTGLDLGTGPGYVAVELARQQPALQIVGLDLSAHMVQLACRQAARTGLNNRVLWPQGDGSHLPFPDGAFDLVVSSFALHHWHDPLRILNEIARVLRQPDGRYCITDLCRDVDPLQRAVAYSSIPVISLLFGSYWGYGGYYESIRAGYTREEAHELLQRSNLPPGEVRLDSTRLVAVLTMRSKGMDG
jgi:ubiquinone/menaquinone biosynthesis C-methylase UbiE